MDWNHVVELAKALAWPVTTLIALAYFGRELTAVLRRIQSAKLPGAVEFAFGQAEVDNLKHVHPAEDKAGSKQPALDASKAATVYWLGYDLMWTIDALLRDAPPYRVMRGLRHAQHHLSEVSTEESAEKLKLASLVSEAAELGESEWTMELRDRMAGELGRIANIIGAQFASLQPGFKSRP